MKSMFAFIAADTAALALHASIVFFLFDLAASTGIVPGPAENVWLRFFLIAITFCIVGGIANAAAWLQPERIGRAADPGHTVMFPGSWIGKLVFGRNLKSKLGLWRRRPESVSIALCGLFLAVFYILFLFKLTSWQAAVWLAFMCILAEALIGQLSAFEKRAVPS